MNEKYASSGNTVPAVPKTQCQVWNDNFERVLEFAKKNGHLKFPRKTFEYYRLLVWLKSQKTRSSMPHYQREKLKLLEKYPRNKPRHEEEDEKWDGMFQELVLYSEANEHMIVSKAENKSLYNWISRQRQLFKSGQLLECRKLKLDSIHFEFQRVGSYKKKQKFTEQQQQRWTQMFKQLEKYYSENGHSMVPTQFQENPVLGHWVSGQRSAYRRGLMDIERIAQLDSLNFVWSVKGNRREL